MARFLRFFLVFFLGYGVSSLWGVMVLPLDLSQLTHQAGRAFVGRCLETSAELDEYGIPATYVRFHVEEGLKGVRSGEEILVKFFGAHRGLRKLRDGESAIVPPKTIAVGSSSYLPGEEYLLFLYPESQYGFTSAVGAGQGKFIIRTNPDGEKDIVNPYPYPMKRQDLQSLKLMRREIQKLVIHP